MCQKLSTQTRPLLFAACLGLLSLGALAQEGYDPLRPIQQRIAKQNVILLLDNSPTMAEVPSFSYYSQTTLVNVSGLVAGVDSTGAAPVAVSFLATKDNGTGAACNPTTKGRNHYFTYTISQVLPSKMAFLKNALGNSMSAYAVWLPPSAWTYSGTTWTGTRPTITHAWNAGTATLTWTIKWTKSYATCTNPPNAPYADAAAVVALQPTITAMSPRNLLSAYSQTVNFGLYSFSGTGGATLRSDADLTDSSANLTALNTLMGPTTASGLNVGPAGKPTYCAVTAATTALNGYYATPDPKRNCPGRGYSILLITDGLADQCNPGGGAWSTCSASNYTSYLPGASEAAWNTSTGRNYRTWVLGLGNQVNRCELNWAAFMGRTDASRPADFGFTSTTSTDPYLAGTRAAAGFGTTTNYAFFADAPDQISSQMNALLGGLERSIFSSLKGETVTSPSIAYNYMGLRLLIPTVEMVNSSASYFWLGHLRAYDIGVTPAVETWDAGAVLSSSPVGTDSTNGRAIYTWNTAVIPPVLVEVKTGNASTINTLCGNCGVTADVVNFIRGYEPGSSTVQRSWLLGPVVNSTPALIGGPEKWSQITNHDNFQKKFASRHPMLYVGSSDGMLHAFDPADGKEIFALIPPDQIAKNVPNTTNPLLSHYSSWSADNPTGQGRWPDQHLYGVANSPRFGDAYDVSVVYDSTLPENYRTLLFLTEGPGGKTLAALDVSHPYPGRTGVTVYGQTGTKDFDADVAFAWADGNGAGANPTIVQPLWAKNGTTSPAMGYTWSIPALAPTSATASKVSVGSGVTTDANHPSYIFDALDGTLLGSVNTGTRSGSLVTSQAFADSTLWSNAITALAYRPDNLANEVLQADLGGRIWSQNIGSTGSILLDATAGHPLYYSAAVANYGQGTATKVLYGYASGTYYEKSAAITGPSSAFRATLFLASKDIATSAVQTTSMALTDIAITGGGGATLSDMAQVTSAVSLFVPKTLGTLAFVLCTVFDPAPSSCGGNSYLVMLSFDPTDLSSGATSPPTGSSVSVGAGFASGFAIAGNQVVVAVSSTTGAASPVVAPGVTVSVSGGPVGASDRPNYYVELQ